MDEDYVIDQTKMFSKGKWTPFNGWKMKGRLKKTILRGTTVFADEKIVVPPGSGQILP